jgi:thiosulfate reductase cytochrome b subunit
MGFHLIAGTLNQAALARGRAAHAAVAWLLCAILFVGWVASSIVNDEVLRVETGYFGAALVLSILLYALYRRPAVRTSES